MRRAVSAPLQLVILDVLAQQFCNHKAVGVFHIEINNSWYPAGETTIPLADTGQSIVLQKDDRFALELFKAPYVARRKSGKREVCVREWAFKYRFSQPQIVLKTAGGGEIPREVPLDLTLENIRWCVRDLLAQYVGAIARRYQLQLEPPRHFDAALLGRPLAQ